MRKLNLGQGFVRELHFMHDSNSLVAAWGNILHTQGLKIVDIAGEVVSSEHAVSFGEMALTADLTKLVRLHIEYKQVPMPAFLDVYEFPGNRLLKRLSLRLNPFCMAFSPDAQLLLVSGADYVNGEPSFEVDRWVWQTGGDLPPLVVPGRVVSFAMTNDRKLLVTGGDDNAVRIWRNDSGAVIDEWRHKATVRRLLFAHNDRWLIAAAGCSVAIWDMVTRRQRARLRPHRKQVNDIAVSHDGRLLATASSDGSVRLWDLSSLQQIRSFNWGIGKVGGLAFAPDGLTIAAGGDDGQVVLWDVDA
jgi:WD40 repeat protein